MTRRRVFLRAQLADLAVYVFLCACAGSVLFLLFREEWLFYAPAALLAPLLLMTLVRRKVGSFVLFMLCHILLGLSPLALPMHTVIIVFSMAVTVIGAIYSTAVRVRGEKGLDRGFALVAVLILAGVSIFLNYVGYPKLTGLLAVYAFVILLGYLICSQTFQVDYTLDILSKAANQPRKTMLRFNNGILVAFLIPVGVAALISPFLPLDRVVLAVGEVLRRFLRWLFTYIAAFFSGEAPVPEEAPLPDQSTDAFWATPPAETPYWLEVLEAIVYYVLNAAVLVGAIALVVYVIYRLYKRFHSTVTADGDVREYIGPQLTREKLESRWRRFRDRLPSFGRDDRERVRRVYFRKVRAQIRKGVDVQAADTTGEIRQKLAPSEEFNTLTGQYNAARYGPDTDVTKGS